MSLPLTYSASRAEAVATQESRIARIPGCAALREHTLSSQFVVYINMAVAALSALRC
jgi:hypothetical protein